MVEKIPIFGGKRSPEKVLRAKELRQNMTPAEYRLWNSLRANRLGGWHFRRQQIIVGFIVDFYCHKAGLVVEVDGPIHQYQQEADAHREDVLIASGLKILRFSNREVMNDLTRVLTDILGALKGGRAPAD